MKLGEVRYTTEGAAFLLRTTSRKVAKWGNGFTRQTEYGVRTYGPVLTGERQEPHLFTFAEVLELRYAKLLMDKGHALASVRKVVAELTKVLGDYPLTNANLATVGNQIVTDQVEPGNLTNPVIMQHLLEYAKELKEGLEFDDEGFAHVWYPLFPDKDIIVARDMRFGLPMTASGIPTSAISSRFELEQSEDDVADWFEIPPEEVRKAILFESQWRQKAA